MASAPKNIPRLTRIFLVLGTVALALGVLALSAEAAARRAFELDIAPLGANLVVLGAIVAAGGLWLGFGGMDRRAGLVLSVALLIGGAVLVLLSAWVEPLLTRFVAVVCFVSGIRGGAVSLGSLLPAWRHEGAIPLGEKSALVSLLAGGGILVFLLYRSQTVAAGDVTGSGLALLTTTVAAIVTVLVLESLVLRVLRGADSEQRFEDERDAAIRDSAGRVAYVVVVIGIVVLAVQLAFGGLSERTALANDALGLSQPLAAGHLLLALLFLSQCGRYITEIWQYERARF